jgi:hypothetical protein
METSLLITESNIPTLFTNKYNAHEDGQSNSGSRFLPPQERIHTYRHDTLCNYLLLMLHTFSQQLHRYFFATSVQSEDLSAELIQVFSSHKLIIVTHN